MSPRAPTRRYAKAVLRRALRATGLARGRRPAADGRITLLTVDFHASDDVLRLIRSFRRFVDPAGPVVVVQNGPRRGSRLRAEPTVTCLGLGINLGHGLGLDYGMRQVTTEYTLVCDPDSAVVDARFRAELLERVERFGAASIDNGAAFYHPVCLGFRTALWKRSRFSFEERWPDWDVAGALTEALGGLRDEALLPRTRSAGPAQRSTRAGKVHHYGEVYAEAFTNTYGMSRKVADPAKDDFEGWSRRELVAYHRRWQRWVADVVEGRATVADFPA